MSEERTATVHLGPDTVHVDLDIRGDPETTAADVMTLSLRFPEWSLP